MASRNGSAEWHGDVQGGDGTVTVGEGAWTGNYSFKSRFEDGEGTNPEELLAASHAGCFSMALSLFLTEAGHPPDRSAPRPRRSCVRSTAPTITKIDLETEGTVPRHRPGAVRGLRAEGQGRLRDLARAGGRRRDDGDGAAHVGAAPPAGRPTSP
jgi:osmotically inducible protein OsmC